MATLEQAAEYQRHLKKMSYKEQVEQENRMKQLRDIQRRKYLEEHEIGFDGKRTKITL